MESWGFKYHGIKTTDNGQEKVYVREFSKIADTEHPKLTFPMLSKTSDVYIVPIFPEYHTELFPDSILKTESPLDFVENEPHRNALSKVYISHAPTRDLKTGDILVIYRMGETKPKKYSSTVTTICIVESVIKDIGSFEELVRVTRKRTVLSENELRNFWNRFPNLKPFVVNILYAHSFPRRPTLNDLNRLGIISDITNMPRGFIKISREHFNSLAKLAYGKK